MKRKEIIVLVVLILLLFNSEAQNLPSFYPFKGFHVGITGQAEFIEKCSFASLFDYAPFDPVPKGRWTCGWEAGIEFSYHFAKYFGISAGINCGTAFSYNCAIYMSMIPGYNDKWGIANDYDTGTSPMSDWEIMFPVKFEFHYPLYKNLFFTAEAGVKVKGIFMRLLYGKDGIGSYRSGLTVLVPNASNDPNEPMEQIKYFNYWGERDLSKISCNLLLGIGLYYKLPYGDLLRFTAGINKSFNNIVEGYYIYHLTGSVGTFAAKNDFIYTQLSYIHTLNFQKAKKHLKKQEYSFSSKKERRKRIIEMLDTW